MKSILFFAAVAISAVCAQPVLAQAHSHNGMDPMERSAGRIPAFNGAPINSVDGANARLNGESQADYIARLVHQDRQAIKELKKQAKATISDEERDELNRQIALLEADIIALQQQ